MIKYFITIVFVIIIIVSSTGSILAMSQQEFDYTLDLATESYRIPIPKSYVYKKTIIAFPDGVGNINNAQDLFIDSEQNLYIADSGNNRIIKSDLDFNAIQVYAGPEDKPFNSPQGVFVDRDGHIFVADTGNNRIVHLDSDGGFIEEFTKPVSDLLGADFVFNPSKIAVSPTGYIYTVRHQQLMQIDAFNRFRGFVGSTRVGFSFTRILLRIFASEEQRSRLARVEPSAFINFTMADDGTIYATTLDYENGQIKRLNSIGENIYTNKIFGEFTYNEQGWLDSPIFEDIAIDNNGIISTVERISGKVYQYDQNGNLLTVFGGKGNIKGMLSLPKSIVVDSSGNLYVYDTTYGIVVYEPTKFIQTVHEAIKYYNQGEYDSSMVYWEEVLSICETYELAHIGIGNTYFKMKNYKDSMDAYQKAMDKVNYSQAFSKYRFENITENFTLVVVIFLISIYLVVKIIKLLHELSFICEEKYKRNRKEIN